jgi:hypothetical protein
VARGDRSCSPKETRESEGRSFCPCCMGRRMVATTLNLLDHVVPKVGLRQFVFTVPHALRARLAYDGPLMGSATATRSGRR